MAIPGTDLFTRPTLPACRATVDPGECLRKIGLGTNWWRPIA